MENLLKDYSNEEVLKALKIVTELKLEREQGDLPEFIREGFQRFLKMSLI